MAVSDREAADALMRELGGAVREPLAEMAKRLGIERGNGHGGPSLVPDNDRRVIQRVGGLNEQRDQAIRALIDANAPPHLFVRGGQLVRVRRDETEHPMIDNVTEDVLRNILSDAADFIRETKDGPRRSPPPIDVVRAVLATGEWSFPALRGLSEVPVLKADGTIQWERGYDAETRLFHEPRIDIGHYEHADTDVAKALALIEETICDFPFEDDASKANAIAMILTPAVRTLINGSIPLFLIDKPSAGTGAGLLADVVALIAIGGTVPVLTAAAAGDEIKKTITSLLLNGSPVILLDNIEGVLRSPHLAAMLTAQTWQDRLLGGNQLARIPNLSLWIATGNNLQIGGDLPRRCVLVRMNARVAQPWTRKPDQFRHPNLRAYVAGQRAELIRATLTICTAWIKAGRPPGNSKSLGSFESWCEILGGILAFAGIPGFLDNAESFWNQANDDAATWEAFAAAWHTNYGSEPVTTRTVAKSLTDAPGHWTEVPDFSTNKKTDRPRPLHLGLGYALRARKDTRFGRYAFHTVKERDQETRALLWMVEVADESHRSPDDHRSPPDQAKTPNDEVHRSPPTDTNPNDPNDAHGSQGETRVRERAQVKSSGPESSFPSFIVPTPPQRDRRRL